MKDKIIEILKSNADLFVSGQEISGKLGITRAAVWKYIKQLQSEGYIIESVSRNGYKLTFCPDILTYEEVKDKLCDNRIFNRIVHFNTIDSTNNKARELAEKGEPEGTVVVAEEQTCGRGRSGRKWYSQAYKGIWMSVILRPETDMQSASYITQIACTAVGKAIKNITDNVEVKWPNDVYLNNKKICGILTEASGEIDKVDYIIVGIGINVNQEKDDFPDIPENSVTSLEMEVGDVTRKNLFCDVLRLFETLYLDYKEKGSSEESVTFCRENSNIIGKDAFLTLGGKNIPVKVTGINSKGELTVLYENCNTN